MLRNQYSKESPLPKIYIVFICISTLTGAYSPPLKALDSPSIPSSYSDLEKLSSRLLPTLIRGNFQEASNIADLHRDYAKQMYGETDPYAQGAKVAAELYKQNLKLSLEKRHQLVNALQKINNVAAGLGKQKTSAYPDPDKVSKMVQNYANFLMDPKAFPEWEVTLCEHEIVNCFLIVGDWTTVCNTDKELFQVNCLRGLANTKIGIMDVFCQCCSEQAAGFPPKTRRERLQNIIKFLHEEGTKKQRFDWEEHRARATLAEDFYIEGEKDNADIAFSELRTELPLNPKDSLSGWVLFACDRHDARRAYEQGDYEKALSFVTKAEGGCYAYGHRSPSKPLAMQHITELKAKILRKLGKTQEAEWAEGDARRIAENLAKCREALTKIRIEVPRVTKLPDGTLHFDFDNPIIIQKGEPKPVNTP